MRTMRNLSGVGGFLERLGGDGLLGGLRQDMRLGGYI